MRIRSSFCRAVAALLPSAFSALAVLLGVSTASAKPITYTGFTISDGKLGGQSFHNARVYLTFESDTDNAQFVQIPVDAQDPASGSVDVYMNSTGKAAVTVVTSTRVLHANFAANQIFVSLDLGSSLDVPHVGARGVGFGSFSATAPGGLEVAYPLGLEDGTIDFGDEVDDGFAVSSGLSALAFDLKSKLAVSGRAWACLGFPDNTCPLPTTPLQTDAGDFYLYQPYQRYIDGSPDDSLSAGFFIADTSQTCHAELALPVESEHEHGRRRKSLRYNAYVVADVSLGKRHFTGAQVYLSFDADASTVVKSAGGYVNRAGAGHVTIISDGRSETADFAPNQVYVFSDPAHANIGFGSAAGGSGYPLSLTAHDGSSLTEYSTLGALSQLSFGGGDPSVSYSAPTALLTADLAGATALSGAASSCVSFDATTTTCTDLTPRPLRTNRGDFTLSEAYTTDDTSSGVTQTYSVNWGLFWTDVLAR